MSYPDDPRADPPTAFWPPVLLVLALACAIGFLLLVHRAREPARPGPDTNPGGTATVPDDSTLGDHRLTIEFLDVGQGDSALIRSPEGKLALVDAGPTDRVVGLLRERGVERLDLVVVSHHHADHYGGMLAVIRAFHPRAFLDAPSPQTSKHYEAILREVRDDGITALQPEDQPRKITLGSVLLTVFPQAPIDPHNENNNSIGLRVDFGDFSALLTGDSEVHERAWWTEHAPGLCGPATILKLAHHGSRNGTSLAWLKLTQPELAVASMAAGNEFGHPHPETLQRLRQAGVPLRRTDQDGSVLVTTDGTAWTERSTRGAAASSALTASLR